MVDFNELIDKHIAREFTPKKMGRYYPSEIGSCLRKLWYSYKHPKEVEPDLLKIFELGNILHDFVVEVLKSEKTPEVRLLRHEFPIKQEIEDFLVSGRADDLIIVQSDHRKILVEVKSTKNVGFVKSPSNHHLAQLQFYMHGTGVHDGALLYVDKTTLKTKAFEVKFDDKEVERIIERFRSLHRHLKEKELPRAEAKETEGMGWMCGYCEYKDKCDGNEK